MSDISVVIADSRKAARASYLKLLQPENGIQVVAEVETRHEVVEALKLKPRILLLDWTMLAVSEVPLLPLVRRRSPQTRVILLNASRSSMHMIHALADGACGYLEDALARTSLAKAVRVVDDGEVWVSRAMVPLLVAMMSRMTLP